GPTRRAPPPSAQDCWKVRSIAARSSGRARSVAHPAAGTKRRICARDTARHRPRISAGIPTSVAVCAKTRSSVAVGALIRKLERTGRRGIPPLTLIEPGFVDAERVPDTLAVLV